MQLQIKLHCKCIAYHNYIANAQFTPMVHTVVVLLIPFSPLNIPYQSPYILLPSTPYIKSCTNNYINVHNRFTTQMHKVYHGLLHIFPFPQLLIALQTQFTILQMHKSFSNHADISDTPSPTSLTLSTTTTFTSMRCLLLHNVQLSPWKYYFYNVKQLCDPMAQW